MSRADASCIYLIITPSNETDFDTIEADILDLCKQFEVQSVAYDPWAATQLAQRLSGDGVPVIEFRANTQMRTPMMPDSDSD